MKQIFSIIIMAIMLACGIPDAAGAKKFKCDLEHERTVKMTGVSTEGYFVKAWAVAKNADKAIDQARVDAVMAAVRDGIKGDSEKGGGVADLPALMTTAEVEEHWAKLVGMFFSGEYLNYVKDVSSTYPKGADNVQTPGGRKVGLTMVLDYTGLRKKLQEMGLIKGLNDHFEYKGN